MDNVNITTKRLIHMNTKIYEGETSDNDKSEVYNIIIGSKRVIVLTDEGGITEDFEVLGYHERFDEASGLFVLNFILTPVDRVNTTKYDMGLMKITNTDSASLETITEIVDGGNYLSTNTIFTEWDCNDLNIHIFCI